MAIIQRRSPWSLLFHERDIDVDPIKFDVWLEAHAEKLTGLPAMKEHFPHLAPGDLEFLYSGITPEEWELSRINDERAADGLAPVSGLDEMAGGLEFYGIGQKSVRVKVPGSIVFRDEDFFNPPRVHVDDIAAAALLAARYRGMCFYVHVIDAKDIVVHGWTGGVPDPKDPFAKIIADQVEPETLEIDVGDEDEVCYFLGERGYLHGAVHGAFDIATGQPVQAILGVNVALEAEAEEVFERTKDLSNADRSERIYAWTTDADRLFVPALLELAAFNVATWRLEQPREISFFDHELERLEGRGFRSLWY